jgi:hypothetical protein
MARYMIFEKTRSFQYKFKGSAEGKNGNDAIQKLRGRSRLSIKSPYIAIPTKSFMKYQLNPTTKKIKVMGKTTTKTHWKRPR